MKKTSKRALKIKHHILMDVKNATLDLPIKSKVLERRYGVGGATIREVVHYLRTVDREPICSDSTGYYFPKNRTEAQHTIAQLRSRVKEINEVANAIEGYFRQESQQGLEL